MLFYCRTQIFYFLAATYLLSRRWACAQGGAPLDAFRCVEGAGKALISHIAQAVQGDLGGALLQQERLYLEGADCGPSQQLQAHSSS